jgi:uncharacterized protein (TIGR03000 family)
MQKGPVQKGGAVQDSGDGTEMAPVPPTPPADARVMGDATLLVSVPEGAKVYVNGVLTRSTGAERRYISRGLEPGYQYTYEVRAELTRDGQTVSETKTVQLRSNATQDLAFTFPAETTLTLNVPEDAEVRLAGNAIEGTGPVRVFKTERLSAGEVWTDYTVEVSVERNGETVNRSKTITLRAGDSQRLDFDFDVPQVAAR